MNTVLKPNTRLALLESGISIMLEKGYNNTGISEVLISVGVPKGSFYHYFDSKEDFALAIISHTHELYAQNMARIFGDRSLTAIERLKKYFSESHRDMLEKGCRKGCLIGNLSQEMADQSECLRAELTKVLSSGQAVISACIEEAQQKRQIRNTRPAAELAEHARSAWIGAMLLAKTLKSPIPLDTSYKLIFEDILQAKK